jgi:hypothetical protein
MNTPLHPFRPAADRSDAGARRLDHAHQINELVDLCGIAGDCEKLSVVRRSCEHKRRRERNLNWPRDQAAIKVAARRQKAL